MESRRAQIPTIAAACRTSVFFQPDQMCEERGLRQRVKPWIDIVVHHSHQRLQLAGPGRLKRMNHLALALQSMRDDPGNLCLCVLDDAAMSRRDALDRLVLKPLQRIEITHHMAVEWRDHDRRTLNEM